MLILSYFSLSNFTGSCIWLAQIKRFMRPMGKGEAWPIRISRTASLKTITRCAQCLISKSQCLMGVKTTHFNNSQNALLNVSENLRHPKPRTPPRTRKQKTSGKPKISEKPSCAHIYFRRLRGRGGSKRMPTLRKKEIFSPIFFGRIMPFAE